MKRLSNSEARQANGGGRYYCKVCGYENDSYGRIFAHCAKHIRAWGPSWWKKAKIVINIMRHF